jgi:hypothetical protein
MAVPAVDPVVLYMMLMAEKDRLFWRDTHVGNPWAPINGVGDSKNRSRQDYGSGNRNLRNRVRTRSKKLRHIKPTTTKLKIERGPMIWWRDYFTIAISR